MIWRGIPAVDGGLGTGAGRGGVSSTTNASIQSSRTVCSISIAVYPMQPHSDLSLSPDSIIGAVHPSYSNILIKNSISHHMISPRFINALSPLSPLPPVVSWLLHAMPVSPRSSSTTLASLSPRPNSPRITGSISRSRLGWPSHGITSREGLVTTILHQLRCGGRSEGVHWGLREREMGENEAYDSWKRHANV